MPLPQTIIASYEESADPEAATGSQTRLEPLYHVLLFDDDEHTYQYVIEMMMTLFGMDAEGGYRVAYDVDHLGEALVKTCSQEEAISGRDAIHAFGPDPLMPNSRGSMQAAAVKAE